jgi:hypothetical protein
MAERQGMELLGHSSELDLPDELTILDEFNRSKTEGASVVVDVGNDVYALISDGNGAIILRQSREELNDESLSNAEFDFGEPRELR